MDIVLRRIPGRPHHSGGLQRQEPLDRTLPSGARGHARSCDMQCRSGETLAVDDVRADVPVPVSARGVRERGRKDVDGNLQRGIRQGERQGTGQMGDRPAENPGPRERNTRGARGGHHERTACAVEDSGVRPQAAGRETGFAPAPPVSRPRSRRSRENSARKIFDIDCAGVFW